jgi:hypothetical protein
MLSRVIVSTSGRRVPCRTGFPLTSIIGAVAVGVGVIVPVGRGVLVGVGVSVDVADGEGVTVSVTVRVSVLVDVADRKASSGGVGVVLTPCWQAVRRSASITNNSPYRFMSTSQERLIAIL